MSRKITFPAMHVVKAGAKGGTHGDVSVCRCIGDFGIPVFHRPGRYYRPEASSLNPDPAERRSALSAAFVVGGTVFDRIDFVVREQIQKREKDKNADAPNSRFRHGRAHAGTSQSKSPDEVPRDVDGTS